LNLLPGGQALSRKIIASDRSDGNGSRLVSIVHAMALAKRIGCRFGFTWNLEPVIRPGFHANDGVHQIFSANFIARYWLGEALDPDAFPNMDFNVISRPILKQAASGSAIRGWRFNRHGSFSRFRDTWSILDLFRKTGLDTGAAFNRVDFSAEIKNAIGAAKIHRNRPVAAIHLRSGDIVHGHHRNFKHVRKVIPSTLTKSLVEKLNDEGCDVLLVGQDKSTIDYLKRTTGAFTSDDFGSGDFAPGTLREFFELSLMARCAFLYAGASNFAEIATMIRGRSRDRVFDLMSWPRAAELVLAELERHESDYHPLEAAFGYQWALSGLEPSLDPQITRRILERAQALDPGNESYVLKLAATDFRDGRLAEGEGLLRSLLENELEAHQNKRPLRSLGIFSAVYARGPFLTEEELNAVSAGARAGCVYAAIYCAYLYRDRRRRADREQAKTLAREFAEIVRSNGAGHLIDIVEAFIPAKRSSRRRTPNKAKK